VAQDQEAGDRCDQVQAVGRFLRGIGGAGFRGVDAFLDR
jgi:hypothetical protein